MPESSIVIFGYLRKQTREYYIVDEMMEESVESVKSKLDDIQSESDSPDEIQNFSI